jgi:glycosyltransferase involved in cell wall biosynthesis
MTHLAVEACGRLGRRLIITGGAGSAEETRFLQHVIRTYTSTPQTERLIEWHGAVSEKQYDRLLSRCRALLFAPEEDFGIAPIEALAAGVPVVAYHSG